MTVLNDVDPNWDLEDLVDIHGLQSTDDKEYALAGIAIDLGTTIKEVKAMLANANITYSR